MAKEKGQNYMHGAAILTIGVILMKLLGFIYKVPIANIIGDDGYSMFLSSYNVYFVFYTLSTAGFPIALSRLIAEANAQNRPMQVRRTFLVAERTFLVIGLIFAAIMFFFHEQLASAVLGNPDAAPSIRTMSVGILLVCLVAAHRGYCEGFGDMIPTTVSQVLEVLVKVVVGLLLAALIMRAQLGKPMAAAGAIGGVVIGSVFALTFMILYKRKKYGDVGLDAVDTPDSDRTILKSFLSIGVPIALGSCIMSILNLVDSSLCMHRLQSAAGFTLKEAQTLYGVYGEATTLFNLPAAFITPLTVSIVPAISALMVKQQRKEACAIAEDSLRIAAFIALPMGVGLAVLSYPIMRVIYPSSHASGPVLLCIMGIASFFVCMLLMENAILQASGKEKLPMIAMIIGSVVKIIINWFLVANRSINIYGAPVGTLCAYIVMAVMDYVFICRNLEQRPRLMQVILRPLAASAIMGVSAWVVYTLIARLLSVSWMHTAIAMLAGIVVAVPLYAVSAIGLRAVTAADMSLIPKGEKIARLLHMK